MVHCTAFGLSSRDISQAMPSMGKTSLWRTFCPTSSILSLGELVPMQAHQAFAAAFELLPRAFSLRSGRCASQASAPSAEELRSLGDLCWLTGLLLLGADCSAALSPAWAASVQQVKLWSRCPWKIHWVCAALAYWDPGKGSPIRTEADQTVQGSEPHLERAQSRLTCHQASCQRSRPLHTRV